MKTLYATGTCSYGDLSLQFDVNAGSIRKVGAYDNWTAARVEYRRSIGEKATTQISEIVCLAKEKFDALTDNSCDLIIAQIAEQLTKLDEGTTDPAMLAEYANVIKTTQEIKYRRLNVPAPKQPIEITELPAPGDASEAECREMVEEAMKGRYADIDIPKPDGDGNGSGNGNGNGEHPTD